MEEWHDLRRDPDDMPAIGEEVHCQCRGRRFLLMRFTGRTWVTEDEEHTKTYVSMWKYEKEAQGSGKG